MGTPNRRIEVEGTPDRRISPEEFANAIGGEIVKCPGCGRNAIHKMCPAWGTPIYMTGQLFTAEMEVQYAEQRQAAIKKLKESNSGLD